MGAGGRGGHRACRDHRPARAVKDAHHVLPGTGHCRRQRLRPPSFADQQTARGGPALLGPHSGAPRLRSCHPGGSLPPSTIPAVGTLPGGLVPGGASWTPILLSLVQGGVETGSALPARQRCTHPKIHGSGQGWTSKDSKANRGDSLVQDTGKDGWEVRCGCIQVLKRCPQVVLSPSPDPSLPQTGFHREGGWLPAICPEEEPRQRPCADPSVGLFIGSLWI